LVTLPSNGSKPGLPTTPPVKGETGSSVDHSLMRVQLEEARKAENRANKAYKALLAEHKAAKKELENVDKRINQAMMSQVKLRDTDGPLTAFSKMQRKSLTSLGLGKISNGQSFGLAAITILLGITAIIGRIE